MLKIIGYALKKHSRLVLLLSTLFLVIAKAVGLIDWSWLIIFFPILLYLGILFLLGLFTIWLLDLILD